MSKSRTSIYLLTLLLVTNIFANDEYSCKGNKPFFDDSKRGWFVGEKPCVKPKIKPKDDSVEPPLTIIIQDNSQNSKKEEPKKNIDVNGIEYKNINNKVYIAWDQLDKLHPDTLKAIEEENRKIALAYPTMENIVEFKKYQRYLIKKSLNFSQQSTIASKQNSVLANWASEVPTSRIALTEKRTYREQKIVETFAKLKDNLILLVGEAPGCPFCEKQKAVLKMFENKYGLSYKLVDISKNPAFAKQMQIMRTPDLFILFRNENNEPKIVRIGTGLHTVLEIRDNILIGLQTIGVVNKELAFRWGVKEQ